MDEHVHQLRLEAEVGRTVRRLNLGRSRKGTKEHREDQVDCDGNRDGAWNYISKHYNIVIYISILLVAGFISILLVAGFISLGQQDFEEEETGERGQVGKERNRRLPWRMV